MQYNICIIRDGDVILEKDITPDQAVDFILQSKDAQPVEDEPLPPAPVNKKARRTPPRKSAKPELSTKAIKADLNPDSPMAQKRKRNDLILKEYQDGSGVPELAERHSMSEMNIRNILNKLGVTFTKGKKPAKEKPVEYPADEEETPDSMAPAGFDDEGLTEEQKAAILEEFNEGLPPSVNTPTLAKKYGVSIKTIWGVIKNRPK